MGDTIHLVVKITRTRHSTVAKNYRHSLKLGAVTRTGGWSAIAAVGIGGIAIIAISRTTATRPAAAPERFGIELIQPLPFIHWRTGG